MIFLHLTTTRCKTLQQLSYKMMHNEQGLALLVY
jgi:hypothetical protein